MPFPLSTILSQSIFCHNIPKQSVLIAFVTKQQLFGYCLGPCGRDPQEIRGISHKKRQNQTVLPFHLLYFTYCVIASTFAATFDIKRSEIYVVFPPSPTVQSTVVKVVPSNTQTLLSSTSSFIGLVPRHTL